MASCIPFILNIDLPDPKGFIIKTNSDTNLEVDNISQEEFKRMKWFFKMSNYISNDIEFDLDQYKTTLRKIVNGIPGYCRNSDNYNNLQLKIPDFKEKINYLFNGEFIDVIDTMRNLCQFLDYLRYFDRDIGAEMYEKNRRRENDYTFKGETFRTFNRLLKRWSKLEISYS